MQCPPLHASKTGPERTCAIKGLDICRHIMPVESRAFKWPRDKLTMTVSPKHSTMLWWSSAPSTWQ